MKSPVVKRSIVIAGHKTSVSLEDAFWKGLKEIAGTRDMTLSELVAFDRFRAPARQPVVRNPAVRARSLPQSDRRGEAASATRRATIVAASRRCRDAYGPTESEARNAARRTDAARRRLSECRVGRHHRRGVAAAAGAGRRSSGDLIRPTVRVVRGVPDAGWCVPVVRERIRRRGRRLRSRGAAAGVCRSGDGVGCARIPARRGAWPAARPRATRASSRAPRHRASASAHRSDL